MEFIENLAAQGKVDNIESSIDYINSVVHFLESHASKLGIEDEVDKFKFILALPNNSLDLTFILSELGALLEKDSTIGLEWIRDDKCFSTIADSNSSNKYSRCAVPLNPPDSRQSNSSGRSHLELFLNIHI